MGRPVSPVAAVILILLVGQVVIHALAVADGGLQITGDVVEHQVAVQAGGTSGLVELTPQRVLSKNPCNL